MAYDAIMKKTVTLAILALMALAAFEGTAYAGADTVPTAPPSITQRLIFVHHSSGQNWLADGNGGLGVALKNNNYFVSDTNYGWGSGSIGDRTDIGNWWEWFRGPNSATYLAALYAENGQHSSYSRLSTDPGGENTIIMFKSCFPNSALGGNINDPAPPIDQNQLRGQGAGSQYMTVANAKGIYIDLLEYFRTRQDKLFIVITAPPLSDATDANNARYFNTWLKTQWLKDYPYKNVYVWDFYDVLTSNGGNPGTNDLNATTGNHDRWWNGTAQYVTDQGSNTTAYSYPGDDHPSAAGNMKATGEYVPLLNYAYNQWQASLVSTQVPNATFGSASIPATMTVGSPYNISATFMNTGNLSWNETNLVRLLAYGDTAALGVNGNCDNHGCGYPEYAIPAGTTVAPGQNYTFNFTVTPTSPGMLTVGLVMARNGAGANVTGFGTAGYATVRVAPSGFDVSQANADPANDTMPSTVMAGHAYNASMTFRNTGGNAWNESLLVRMLAWGNTTALGIPGNCDNHGCGYPEYAIGAGTTVAPGQNYAWNFTMTPATAGYASLGITMAHNGNGTSVTGFGTPSYKSIAVTPATFDIAYGNAWYQGNTVPANMTVGQMYNVSVTYMNDGWAPWSEGDSIRMLAFGDTAALGLTGDCNNYDSGYPEYALPAGQYVLLWQAYTYNFTVTPTAPGDYMVGFAMVQNDGSTVTPFGGYGYATVTVT